MSPRTTAHRRDALWLAALVHRLSGVALACFLPLHFLALGLAIDSEARLDGFLRWSQRPLVKLAEAGLVALLAVHLLGGLRILMVELVAWRPGQTEVAAAAAVLALVLGGVFFAIAI
jgi:fumarate reductase subunit D